MPLRRIRDGLVTSTPFNTLSWREQSFFVRLMLTADDYGCYHADPVILRAHLYPRLLDRVSTADVASMLAACENAGLVSTYDADGQKYVLVHKFKQAIRAARKYPAPPPELSASQPRRNCDTPASHPRPDNNTTPDNRSHISAKQERAATTMQPPTPAPPAPQPSRSPQLSDFERSWLAAMCQTRKRLAAMDILPQNVLTAALEACHACPDAPQYAPQLRRYYTAPDHLVPYPPHYRPVSYEKMFRDLPDVLEWACKWCSKQDAIAAEQQRRAAQKAALQRAEQPPPLTPEQQAANRAEWAKIKKQTGL